MKFQKGQSLIEVLIALAAAVALAAAIATTVITSLSNVEFTKNQNLATQYAREGLEILRETAKNSWTTFSSYNSVNYCLDQNKTLSVMVGNTCTQNVGIFVRQIIINQGSSACSGSTKVTSIVSWFDSKCVVGNAFCHTVTLESCFADINTTQSP